MAAGRPATCQAVRLVAASPTNIQPYTRRRKEAISSCEASAPA